MKKDECTFEEAYKTLQNQNRIFIEGKFFIFDLSEEPHPRFTYSKESIAMGDKIAKALVENLNRNTKEYKEAPKNPYRLAKIDLLDTYIYADIFEDEAYTILEESENLEHLLDMAIGGFLAENPKYTTYKDWQEEAENGGYEFEIFDEGPSSIFRGSMMLLHPIVFRALNLTRKYHYGQIRKGDYKQYIIHILEISRLLFGHGGSGVDAEIIAASLCHDLLEDTACTEQEIEESCSKEVLRIVKAVSNDKTLEGKERWKEKKLKYIESAKNGGEKAMVVCVADKIVNLKALLKAYEQDGEKIWNRFNAGKSEQLWFQKSVLKMLKGNLNNPLVSIYEQLVTDMENI